MLPRSARTPETLSELRLAEVIAEVQRERAVLVRTSGLAKLTRGAQVQLLEALARAGLEHTGEMIRVPLRQQVRDALLRAGELGISESQLARAVKGARSAAELRLITRELAGEGVLASVAEGNARRFVLRSAQLLADLELDRLAALATQLSALAKATKPSKVGPRTTLERRALEAPLAQLAALARERTAAKVEARGSAQQAVEDAVRAAFLAAPAASGLVRVPDVIRALEPVHARSALLAATDALARAGVLELRPEASITRIAEEDRVRCPIGPDGTPLSYARMMTQPQGAQA
jgi:hypothetical protein